ncbi:hypothetical protein [Pelomonas sp. SE-A7]|uniref:hypothetical protein n=1 Tax=Pelomonas sp. SE-A7 TaxID=3054953 RepID=UPI00259D109F|nr:hypothetical protein [Pelomonas sp. SE-A7]MDM4766626.1 hypothetical protein [Pelomonas sp. SE-A7]
MLLSLRTAPTIVTWPPTGRAPTPMERCLLLALLLHGLLVAWIGSTPGTAQVGEGLWGRINVTLRGEPGPNRKGSDSAAAPRPSSSDAPPRDTPRIGGQVRSTEAPTDAAPGAARVGQTNPIREEPELSRLADTVPGGQLQPLPSEKLGAGATAAPAEPAKSEPSPEPRTLNRVSNPEASSLQTLQSLPASSELLQPAPTLAPSKRAVSQSATPALKTLPNALPTSTSVDSVVTPELTATPKPMSRIEQGTTASPLTSKPLPTLPSRVQANEVHLPAALPQTPTPLGTVAAPTSTAVPAKPLPSLPTPTQASPAPAIAPLPETPRLAAEPVQAPVAAAPAATTPAASPSTSPSTSDNSAPQRTVTTPGASNAAPAGAPDAGRKIGSDLALPPAPGASAPKLNLELPRSGGPLARQGVRGMVDLVPAPPDKKSKLEQELEAAKRADCRRAYENAGILAVIPLALDTARGKGCTWK